MRISDRIVEIFAARGGDAYFGEPVSQLEHALQAAHHAAGDAAPDWLVVAALVHDIGHLLHDLPEHIADLGIDARHEDIGHAWLAQHFGPEVTAPVRMSVMPLASRMALGAPVRGSNSARMASSEGKPSL